MPQLLCSLEAEEGDLEALVAAAKAEAAGGASPESLDWGTVAVYTCTAVRPRRARRAFTPTSLSGTSRSCRL